MIRRLRELSDGRYADLNIHKIHLPAMGDLKGLERDSNERLGKYFSATCESCAASAIITDADDVSEAVETLNKCRWFRRPGELDKNGTWWCGGTDAAPKCQNRAENPPSIDQNHLSNGSFVYSADKEWGETKK